MSVMSTIVPATWYDKQFGKNGTGAYLTVAWGMLTPIFISALFFLYYEFKFHHLPNVLVSPYWVPAIIFLYIEIKVVQMILDGRKILQAITIESEFVSGKFYFGKKIRFNISEIKSISYYQITKEMQMSHFLDAKSNISGIDIVLNNGEQCRISPKMENFSDMVGNLKEKLAQHAHGEL